MADLDLCYTPAVELAARICAGTLSPVTVVENALDRIKTVNAKLNCFCFTEQRLAGGEKREMAVVFFVDPALAKDSDQADLNTITLSYTFYALRDPQRPVADNGTPPAPGRL